MKEVAERSIGSQVARKSRDGKISVRNCEKQCDVLCLNRKFSLKLNGKKVNGIIRLT